MAIGYDPARLAMLRVRAIDAVEELRALTSDDPAAWPAVVTARIARDHVEQMWLPLIDRILASEAMVTWAHAGLRPGAARRLAHHRFATDLAAAARRLLADPDPDEVLAVAVCLRLAAAIGGAEAPLAFFAELGGAATGRLFLTLGGHDHDGDVDANRVLAVVARDALAHATRPPGLDTGFGGDLVAALVGDRGATDRDPTGTLLFLLDGAAYGRGFLVGVARAAARFEALAASGNPGEPYWPRATLGSALTPDRPGDAEPMDVLLEHLADDPAAWTALLADPVAARHLLAERRFSPESSDRLTAAVADLTADPALVLRLLADPATLTAIVAGGRFDDELTAALVESGLGTSVLRSPALLAEGGRLLTRVAELAGERVLVPGARRGLAVAVAPYLPELDAIALVAGGDTPVELTVSAPDSDTVPYRDLARLFGQVLGDEAGGLILGRTLSDFGATQVEAALAAARRVPRGEAGATPEEVAPLRRFAEVVELTLDGADEENARLTAVHVARQAGVETALTVLGSGVSVIGHPVAKVTSAASRLLDALIQADPPEQVDPAELRAHVASSVTVALVEDVLASPELAARFAVELEPAARQELGALIDRFHAEPAARHELAGRITSLLQREHVDARLGEWLAVVLAPFVR